MAGCKYFTSVDVVSASWQVLVSEADVYKTAFCTPFGNSEWLRMPFGLVNASSTYQRLMDIILSNTNSAYPYIDDVFIYSKTWLQHLRDVRAVFLHCAHLT